MVYIYQYGVSNLYSHKKYLEKSFMKQEEAPKQESRIQNFINEGCIFLTKRKYIRMLSEYL